MQSVECVIKFIVRFVGFGHTAAVKFAFWFRIASALGQTEDPVKGELLKEELCWRL